jgi:predicted phage tail protein
MSVAEYTDLLAKELFRKDFQQEVSQLQHEFESYKKKAQLVLKSKSDKEYESNKEVHELQEKCANLGLLVERLQKESDDNNENYLVSLQKLREDIRQKSDKHAYEMMQAEHFHKQKLQELQQHVLTTRNRMKDLLEEKEKEIAALRESLNTHSIVNSNLLSESTSKSFFPLCDFTS